MLELALRVIGSLLVVVGLLWVVARAGSRRFGGAARGLVRVVARQPLARTASLAVVEVGERVLVVGVSENGVSLLTEMDPSEIPAADPADPDLAAGADAGSPLGALGPLVSLGSLTRGTPRAGRGDVASTGRADSTLAGSVLSSRPWRQAWEAATNRNGGRGD